MYFGKISGCQYSLENRRASKTADRGPVNLIQLRSRIIQKSGNPQLVNKPAGYIPHRDTRRKKYCSVRHCLHNEMDFNTENAFGL